MEDKPLISVVMPTWNGERYLRESVQSILNQTFTRWELVVVTNGSTDGTEEILRSFNEPRLRVVSLEHQDLVEASDLGVRQARAEWVARQDDDDVSLPDRLARQWEAVSRKPDCAFCHTATSLIGDAALMPPRQHFTRTHALLIFRMCVECPVVQSSVLFKKAVYEKAGGYREEDRHAEDFGLWGRLLALGQGIGIPEELVAFRRHADSYSKTHREGQHRKAVKLAHDHAMRFMTLSADEAARLFSIYHRADGYRRFRDWLWVLCHCVPRLKWQSVELYAWLTVRTLRRLLGRD